MPGATATNAYEGTFLRSYDHVPAQKRSRLMMCCKQVAEYVAGATFHWDAIGQVPSQRKEGRYAPTPVNPAPHFRRLGFRYTDQTNVPVATQDLRRMVADPKSDYVEEVRRTHGRSFDDDIIGTLGGVAMVKDEVANTVTEVPLPASQIIPHGGSGLTKAKLITAREILDANEVGDIMENPRYWPVSSKQVTDLLNITEVGSADYNTVKVLVDGKVATFMGFKFIPLERLRADGNVRLNYAFTADAIRYGGDEDLKKLRINEMPEHSYDYSVYAEWELGSLRTNEKRVVQVQCQEG